MKNGFTLVELSIVLVIIGLLIGGILVGQSLIDSAKLQSFIRQMQQYDIAINGFKQKFKQYPGDSSYFDSPGDNDLILEVSGASDDDLYSTDGIDGEIGNVWKHLSDSKSLPASYDNDTSAAVRTEVNVPKAAYGDAGVIFFTNGRGVFKYYLAEVNSSVIEQIGGTRAFFPVEALAVDQKMDDGDAVAGKVQAKGSGVLQNPPSAGSAGSESCVITGQTSTYNSSYSGSDRTCNLTIDAFIQTGKI